MDTSGSGRAPRVDVTIVRCPSQKRCLTGLSTKMSSYSYPRTFHPGEGYSTAFTPEISRQGTEMTPNSHSPSALAARAYRLREQTWQFCHDLTLQNKTVVLPRGLFTSLVHQAEQIDCRSCARCCKQLTPVLTGTDIDRLAQSLGMDQAKLVQKYLRKATDFSGHVLKKKPCAFLKEKSCSVYPSRPATCRGYPHLTEKEILGNPVLAFQNTLVCPMVFVVIDGLRVRS